MEAFDIDVDLTKPEYRDVEIYLPSEFKGLQLKSLLKRYCNEWSFTIHEGDWDRAIEILTQENIKVGLWLPEERTFSVWIADGEKGFQCLCEALGTTLEKTSRWEYT